MAYESTKTRKPARRRRPPFGPEEIERERETLEPLLYALSELHDAPGTPPGRFGPDTLRRLLRRFPRSGSGFFGVAQIITAYRLLGGADRFKIRETALLERLHFRPVRTHSGVAPVAVFTKPFPCPGQCIFCPNDVRMPKSYLSDEPGAQRAEDNGFDPYQQTIARLSALHATGHPVDKVEIIVLGGTWSFYPLAYQIWFVRRCFEALNEFSPSKDAASESHGFQPHPDAYAFHELPRHVDGAQLEQTYNQQVTRFLKRRNSGSLLAPDERGSTDWTGLERAHRDNERAGSRCVGLVLETRPDHVSKEEVVQLRRLGATKVQIGVQSVFDDVLSLNKRGHDIEAVKATFARLRAAGFKIQAHYMPNLYGSTPEMDIAGYEQLISDPELQPDELKIYPCSLIESAELMTHYRAGGYVPYDETTLVHVLSSIVALTPRYVRLNRVIRDIPGTDIVAGNRKGNLREVVDQHLKSTKRQSVDIRTREVRGENGTDDLHLKTTEYETENGTQVFLEWVTADDRLAGFLRLSLPRKASFIDELGRDAIIREVHVYGNVTGFAQHSRGGSAQHGGLGKSLIDEAFRITQQRGYERLSVISAVGTREYYRRLGFSDVTDGSVAEMSGRVRLYQARSVTTPY